MIIEKIILTMYFDVVTAADSGGYAITSNAVIGTHVCSLNVEEFQTLPFVAVDHCKKQIKY